MLFLPPYTPQFNPIENMFSKWKQLVRRNAPRDSEHLNQLITQHLMKLQQMIVQVSGEIC